jgi:hypothetical protein
LQAIEGLKMTDGSAWKQVVTQAGGQLACELLNLEIADLEIADLGIAGLGIARARWIVRGLHLAR